ncbi:hypothetical protein HYT95_01280 [Candidatus Peregrinibacteria bacterium]|nr:hypothetical protein [Candidatus Peregrinibacteria bacterium]
MVSIGDETPPWALRIGKAFERMIDLERRINEMEQEGVAKKKWAILLLCLCVPVFAQILSIGIVVFLLDVLSTFLLALASTERIAAILGGVLGWGTAVLLHVLGAPGDLFLLVIGGAVGWYVGPFLHWLRAYLSLVPVVETVQSS